MHFVEITGTRGTCTGLDADSIIFVMLQTTQVDKTILVDFIFQFLFITIQYQNYQIKTDKV